MKKLLILSLLCAMTLQMVAAPVDVASARAKAQQFAQVLSFDGRHRAPAAPGSMTLVYTEPSAIAPTMAVYYIFNTEDSYLVVSADDRSEAVLAYGDAPIDINDIPDAMRYWLGCYKQEIEYLQANPDLRVEASRRAPAHADTEDVEPLLTAMWDQSAPYYNQCPRSGGSYCLTGCAATSLSMICYYWQYPKEITTSFPGYTTSSLHMSLDALGPTTFDYDNMLDRYRGSYSSEQANAVAHLMRYVGQAEHMDYTPSASGVSAQDIARAVTMLGFDSDARMVFKENYGNEEWALMIQEELYNGRPLEYCGFGGMSGHAFNVDGYDADKDMYHVNWGWSGSSNGYFALNAFRGGSITFRTGQLMIIGLEPPATVPTIRPSLSRLSINGVVEKSTTGSFIVKGVLLTSNVSLTLNDESGAFSLSTDRISLDEIGYGKRINVIYKPTSVGSHHATVKINSEGAKEVTINIHGNAVLETYDPVMLDASDISPIAFTAHWRDNTPSENVNSYRMELATVPFNEQRFQDTFNVNGYTGSSTSDCSAHLDELTHAPGWTGSKVYHGENYLRVGNANNKGWLETPVINMSGNQGKMTVALRAKTAGTDTSAPLNISCANSDTTILVTNEETEIRALLDCHETTEATMRISGKRILIYQVTVMAGDDFSPVDWNRAACISDIIGNSFKITDVTPGTYAMRLQAIYTDGTMSPWSNEVRVVLNWAPGDVNCDGEVNIADVNAVIDHVLEPTQTGSTTLWDVNGDGEINIADVNAIIDMILD